MALELPHSSGLCCSAGVTAGMASRAACCTWGGGLKWSPQSCGPRRQSWRRLALDLPHRSGLCCSAGAASQWSAQSCVPRRQSWRRSALEAPAPVGIVLLCRRCLVVERAVLRATPPVLAAVGVGIPAPLGIVFLRRRRQYGVCLYGLSDFSLRLVHPALDHRYSSGDLAKPACTGFSSMYFAIRAHSCSFLTQWS